MEKSLPDYIKPDHDARQIDTVRYQLTFWKMRSSERERFQNVCISDCPSQQKGNCPDVDEVSKQFLNHFDAIHCITYLQWKNIT